jgi:hypothetical protein
LRNPWLDLPADGQDYVLPEDRPHVEAFNAGARPDFRLDLRLVPEPFLGPRDAPLVILMLNPGRVPADLKLHRGEFRHVLRANLGNDPEAQRHLGFRPEFAAHRPWWRNRFARVIDEGHSPEELSRKVLSIEFHGYHARRWRPIPITLPSQHYGFWLVGRAMKRGATIIPARGKNLWKIAVPKLDSYEHLVPTRNPRAAYVSPGNLGAVGFQRVLDALA